MRGNLATGAGYLFKGARIVTQPGLRLFVLMPLLINLVLFAVLTAVLIAQFGDLVQWAMDFIPGWLHFLAWILWLLFGVVLILLYGYSFAIIANIVAAPFNGWLAEMVEERLTGQAVGGPNNLAGFLQLVPRTLKRELQKLLYILPRALLIFLITLALSFIPPLNLIAPVIGFIWGAWTLAVEYVDYPVDNNLLPFRRVRDDLGSEPLTAYGFGGIVLAATMVPVLNIFIMPAAVAGGTALWIERWREKD